MGLRALLRAHVGEILGALALATILAAPASAQTVSKQTDARAHSEASSNFIVTEMHITLFKYALNLKPEQMSYWIPVEAALRALSQRQPATFTSVDGAERSSNPGQSANARWKRLAAAALPLIRTFDASQKRSLHTLARTFGFERYLASN
jgi:hypothetical protein